MVWKKEHAEELQKNLNGLVNGGVRVTYSDLGGANRASLMILICFDKKETWQNGIMENSQYARFSLHHDEKLECFVKSHRYLPKFRKATAKDLHSAFVKLFNWIDEANIAIEDNKKS